MKLMTNNPAKYIGLKGYGLAVSGRVPLLTPITKDNKRYLETKRAKMGHIYGAEFNGHLSNLINSNGNGKSGVETPIWSPNWWIDQLYPCFRLPAVKSIMRFQMGCLTWQNGSIMNWIIDQEHRFFYCTPTQNQNYDYIALPENFSKVYRV